VLRFCGRLLVAGVAAASAWAYLVSHVIINWEDGPWKSWAVLAHFLVCSGAALYSAYVGGKAWRWGCLVVLGLALIGETHRLWLRHRYQAQAEPIDPFVAVTTTDLKVRRYTMNLPKLGTSRLRVVHLTDLHATPSLPANFADRVVAEVRALEPDLLVLTGDFVTQSGRTQVLRRFVEGLSARYGAFAVLGNHDYWSSEPDHVRSTLEQAGVRMLSGRCEVVPVEGGTRLRLCGTEAPWGPASPALAPVAFPTLVLSHTPDNVFLFAEQKADVVFAGHTHGGQVRLSFLGSLIIPSVNGRLFDRGHFVVEQTHLVVSAGVGADSPPLRLFCPPELVVVDMVGTAP